jgi:hypothetical protein
MMGEDPAAARHVFEQARRSSREPTHWAGALLHDLGKAVVSPCHAAAGADLLDRIANRHVQWLVAHHLDLLREPKLTRTTLALDPRLRDLERLRAWDLAGREIHALVPSVERALGSARGRRVSGGAHRLSARRPASPTAQQHRR